MDTTPRNPWLGRVFFALAAAGGVGWLAVSGGEAPEYALIPGLLALVAACAGVVATNTRWGILATAALCLGCSWYLFDGKLDACGEPMACSIDSYLDCGAVNDSAWSEAFGLPITLFGMAFYAGLMLVVFGANEAAGRIRAYRLDALFGIANVLYSLFLGWISAQLGAFCIVCITLYLGNAVLLWAGFRGLREEGAGFADDLGGTLQSSAMIGLVVTFVIVVLGGNQPWQKARAENFDCGKGLGVGKTDAGTPAPPRPVDQLAKLYTAVGGDVPILDGAPVKGPGTAPLTVVEFADYGCPHCAKAAKEVKDLLAETDQVQVYFQPFALSHACNPALPDPGDVRDIDRLRCDAAFAAHCAHEQDAFWAMNDQLFTNQGYFERDNLRFMAQEIGLDVDAFLTCLDSDAARESVAAAGRAGDTAGVRGTPAFFMTGGPFGDQWIDIQGGPAQIFALVDAIQQGVDLPPPSK